MYYFISDLHLGHFNIIRYCKRPFETLQQMDLTLIRNWNTRIQDEDTVFFLGDFCMKKSSEAPEGKTYEYYRKQLKGNIIFITGNHDKNNGTKSIIESMVIKYGGQRIYLTHNPQFAKKEFAINFVGHVHEKWKFRQMDNSKTVMINLGVENWKYMPVTINEIFSELAQWRKAGKKC